MRITKQNKLAELVIAFYDDPKDLLGRSIASVALDICDPGWNNPVSQGILFSIFMNRVLRNLGDSSSSRQLISVISNAFSEGISKSIDLLHGDNYSLDLVDEKPGHTKRITASFFESALKAKFCHGGEDYYAPMSVIALLQYLVTRVPEERMDELAVGTGLKQDQLLAAISPEGDHGEQLSVALTTALLTACQHTSGGPVNKRIRVLLPNVVRLYLGCDIHEEAASEMIEVYFGLIVSTLLGVAQACLDYYLANNIRPDVDSDQVLSLCRLVAVSAAQHCGLLSLEVFDNYGKLSTQRYRERYLAGFMSSTKEQLEEERYSISGEILAEFLASRAALGQPELNREVAFHVITRESKAAAEIVMLTTVLLTIVSSALETSTLLGICIDKGLWPLA